MPTSNLELRIGSVAVQGKRRLAIRDSFIKETGPKLIRARQHHAFKLYLLALWCHYPQGSPRLPHLENKELGVLLGVGRRGDSRRSGVGHVLAVLEKERLVGRRKDGRRRQILVHHEGGQGKMYTRPKGGGPNAYVEVPGEFFAHGWLEHLSARAILVMLIALREERFLHHRRQQAQWKVKSFDWFQPVAELAKRYHLGRTTIEKGIKELKRHGFLTARLTARHPRDRSLVAPRNLYSNHAEIFSVEPRAAARRDS